MFGTRKVRWIMVLALAGCTAAPVRLGPDSDPKVAREVLGYAAGNGPVRLQVNSLPRTSDEAPTLARLAGEAARGVRGMDVRFAEPPTAIGSARLILLFDPPPNTRPRAVCAAPLPPAPVSAAPPLRLQAIFCDGGAFIADATGTTEGNTAADVDRLVWRTTGRLFPDDYQETYGIGRFFGF